MNEILNELLKYEVMSVPHLLRYLRFQTSRSALGLSLRTTVNAGI